GVLDIERIGERRSDEEPAARDGQDQVGLVPVVGDPTSQLPRGDAEIRPREAFALVVRRFHRTILSWHARAQNGVPHRGDSVSGPPDDRKQAVIKGFRRSPAGDALRVGEAHALAMLDAALDAFVTIDHRGVVREFNLAAEWTFGYRREEALGRELAE